MRAHLYVTESVGARVPEYVLFGPLVQTVKVTTYLVRWLTVEIAIRGEPISVDTAIKASVDR